jgi:hypothetical protein
MIELPEKCLRSRDDCEPLAQIQSDDETSFFCCGHSSIKSREIEQDRFRLCFKNKQIDDMTDNDEADMHDLMSVVAQALSADTHMQRDGWEP